MSEKNERVALLFVEGEQRREYEQIIMQAIKLWADYLTSEQKEFLQRLVVIHGIATALKVVGDSAPPGVMPVMEGAAYHLYDSVNRWARKGGTMSDAHFKEVYDLLERVATEVREHYENRINGT